MFGNLLNLNKALYGPRQGGLLWNGPLVKKVVKHDMEQYKTDPCVFRPIRKRKVVLILVLHVNDIGVAGSNKEVDQLHAVLNEGFTTNNFGELTWCTGCTFSRDLEKSTLNITQKVFIETVAFFFLRDHDISLPRFP